MHYYKFNIPSWTLKTRHLSPEEEGIYLRLLNFYYDTEKPIPLETQSVIRRLLLESYSDKTQAILDEFFTKTEKGYEKEKCNEIIKEYQGNARKNKKNGAKGGRPRKDATSTETQEKPSGLLNETEEKPKHNPNQEPITNNHKPVTKCNGDKSPSSRFVKPDIVDVHDYFRERQCTDPNQPQRFYDFYESKNWMVGKNKMKDWKAAVRNWLSRLTEKQQSNMTAQEKRAARNAQIFDYDKATTF